MCYLISLLKSAIIVCLLLNVPFVNSFNIDSSNYAVYQSAENRSMFGFSVAVHKQGTTSWVLVGAPEAQSLYQRNLVSKGGAVYKCRTDSDDMCQEIPFDRNGNTRINNKEIDHKHNQWFGATVAASGNPDGGPVVACAPRYLWYTTAVTDRRDPVGTCYVADGAFNTFEEYSPCRTNNWGYHRQGSCQAGFSAAINSIGDRLFIGAPGSYYWQGQMYSVDAHAKFDFKPPGIFGTTFGAKGSVHQQNLADRPAVFQTREGQNIDDDSYLGYSTIVGDFQGNGEQGVAAGMPRGAGLYGKVLLYSWDLTNYKNISGNQLGSYFGYALAAADVDGDKKLDLIVGAPMHTEPNTQGKYDVGRVYVFYQGTQGQFASFSLSSHIDGINSRSRFGHSLAGLGDLNQDGFEDFAVGAPYDGPHNRGAVYIFYGSSKGVLEKYGQVIYAEDVQTLGSATHINTFGFSLSGGLDMDGNDYPDMAVGAYLADTAFFFRSRPVVRVDAFVRFQTPNKQIDVSQRNCAIQNQTKVACTFIEFCFKYSGKGIPDQIRLNVQYILDTKKPNLPRMAFEKNNNYTFYDILILKKDERDECKSEKVYVKNEIRDMLTQLEAEVKYSMVEEERDRFYRRDPKSILTPVLDLNSPPSRKDSLSIQKNCGNDNVCIPDLFMKVTKNVDKYLLDSNVGLEFDIIVSNAGEDSFETTFTLKYPEGVHYIKTEKATCSPDEHKKTVVCDIGNPLAAGKTATFKAILMPDHAIGMSPSFVFDLYVNSTNPEENYTLANNHKTVVVDIIVDSSLELDGKSIPHEVYLNFSSNTTSEKTIAKESDIGPQVLHLYTLRNRGPSNIEEAEMYILWPWRTLGGEDLLYLLEPPHVPQRVKCDIQGAANSQALHANYKGYKLEHHAKTIWERYEIDSSSDYSDRKYGTDIKVETGPRITASTGDSNLVSSSTNLDRKVQESGGDASEILEERHKEKNTSSFGSSSHESTSFGLDSSGDINTLGRINTTESRWRTGFLNGQRVKKYMNITTVRDSTGKVIDTYTSTDDGYFQLESAASTSSQNAPTRIYTTETKWTTIYRNGKPMKTYTDFTTVRDETGKIVDTYTTSDKQSGAATRYDSFGRTQDSKLESRFKQKTSYEVGGGVREGGSTSRPRVEEDEIIRQASQSSTSQNEDTFRYEEQRRIEEAKRIAEANAKRLAYEERRRKEEEERKRQQAFETERVSKKAYEEQYKKDELERIRKQELEQQKKRLEEESRRKQVEEENRRKQEMEETRRRQQQEEWQRKYQEDIRRRQQEQEIRLRQQEEETRRRQQEDLKRKQEEEARRLQQTDETRRKQQEDEYRRRQYEEAQRRQQAETERRRYEESQRSYSSQEETRRQQTDYYNQQNRQSSSNKSKADDYYNRAGYDSRYGSDYYNTRGGGQGAGYSNRSASGSSAAARGSYDSRTSVAGGGSTHDSRYGYDARGSAGRYNQTGGSSVGSVSSSQGGLGQFAAGNGFRTNVLDLGIAEQSAGATGLVGGRGGGAHGTVKVETEITKDYDYDDDYEYSEEQSSHWTKSVRATPNSYTHNYVNRDNVRTDRPEPYTRHRSKRQTPIDPKVQELLAKKCVSNNCFLVRCVVQHLKKDEFVSIVLRSRLNDRAVRQLSTSEPVKLSSMMVARISKLPYIKEPKDQPILLHEVFTEVKSETEPVPKVVPLWIILLSAIAGTLILLLVIWLLYKCGFFRRNRPSSTPERQPLNRNGFHHGDEAL